MIKRLLKKRKFFIDILRAIRFFRSMDIKPVHLIFPSVLAFLASLCEGASLALLIPTVKGIFTNNLTFINDINILGRIVKPLFLALGQRQSVIFGCLLLLIFVSVAVKNVLQYFSLLATASLGQRFSNNLRVRLYKRYLSFGKIFFDQNTAGHLHQILFGFTNNISGELGVLQRAIYTATCLFVYFAIMLRISTPLTLFTLIIIPLLHFSTSWLVKKMKRSSSDLAKTNLELNKKIANALSCIPLVKAYRSENREAEWFAHASGKVKNLQFSMAKKSNLVQPINELIILSTTLLLVSAAAFLIVGQKANDVAGYMVFFLLLRRSTASLSIFNAIRISLARARGPISEVLRVFDDKDKYFIVDGGKEFPGIKNSIEFNNLSYAYPKGPQTLKGITFSAKKGTTTAVVGATGAGKTTIISLLMRFYDSPKDGITIDGKDIRDFTLDSFRSKIALVSQEPLLFNAPLKLNITYGMDHKVSDVELNDALKKSRLYDFALKLPEGIGTEIGDRGVNLSGGEKQRVAICRALLKKAEIILLDEATSALDSITERIVQEALAELTKDTTTLVIAHRLATIKHAENIVVIDSGNLIEQGSLEQLIDKKGRFYLYWQEQKFY